MIPPDLHYDILYLVKKKRMMKYKGSDNMSDTTRMLLNKIENHGKFRGSFLKKHYLT